MNSKGASPTLTKILIAALIGVFTLVTLFSSYITFLGDNGVSISNETQGYYANLSKQQGNLNNLTEQVTAKETANAVWEGISNVFVVGLGAITKFFQMIPIIGELINIIESAIPGFSGLFMLASLIILVYITMQIIASKRGTTYKP